MGQLAGQIANRLRQKGEETLDFFGGLADGQWEVVVYTEGAAWKVHEVLCHFVSAERAFLRLFADILAGGEGSPEGFDIDGFNAAQVEKLRGREPGELLDLGGPPGDGRAGRRDGRRRPGTGRAAPVFWRGEDGAVPQVGVPAQHDPRARCAEGA